LWFTGDIVIAADGIKSVCRKHMAMAGGYANKDQPYPTGDAAYRLLIPREKVQHDPELLAMLDRDVAMRYMGPGGHIMAYPLKGNKVYNMVLIHPSKTSGDVEEDAWTTTGERKKMMSFYGSWSPAIRKWLSYAGEENEENIPEWTLNMYPPLPTWIRGGVALIGDACHPMLPYVAQGAANGIEDAAVIATALNCTSNVHLALRVYEAVRKERAEKIAASASDTSRSLHLSDGPEQEKRDKDIQSARREERAGESDLGDKWRDQQWQDFMWGIDVMRETVDKWAELSVAVMGQSERFVSFL
jgi:salicylate hydroxylase